MNILPPNKANTNIGLLDALALVFIVLKLCGVIHWSWLWVLAPWWVPLGIVVLVAAIAGTFELVTSK